MLGSSAVAELLTCGTRALEVDGDLQASRRWFEAAYSEAERAEDAPVMAQAALGLGGLWADEQRTAATAGRLRARLRQALALVDPASTLALQAVLDRTAVHRYRQRIAEIDTRAGDDAAARAERDWLLAELAAGVSRAPSPTTGNGPGWRSAGRSAAPWTGSSRPTR